MTGPPVAVVTGAGRGIGAAVVRRLSADWWAVIAVDRCADDPGVPCPLAHAWQLAELAQSLPKVHAVQADVRDGAATAGAVDLAERDYRRLHATADLYHLADPDAFAGQQLAGRLFEPAEVAEVVAWACSPAAAALNGSALHAGGGFSR